MGILNFFKKKEIRKEEPELKKIKFSEIQSWIDNKKNITKKKEKEILDLIKGKIEGFLVSLNEKVKILENIDIESKKVEGRVKIIVRQGLDEYLHYVYIFMKELKELENKNIEKTFKDINKIFTDFHKHSNVFYHRANYLIGDEIGVVKQEINNLSKYFAELFIKDKETIKSFEAVSSIELKLSQLNSINNNIDEINLEIKSLDDDINNNNKKERGILEEIDKIKKSKEYLENIKRRKEIESAEKKLEESILKLKSFINFKDLSNICHSDKKSMDIIKEYKGNFKMAFQKNNLADILKLLHESNIDSEIIKNKIKDIDEKKQNIVENKELVKDNRMMVQLGKIQKVKYEIEGLNSEKVRFGKKHKNIERTKKDILTLISQEVENIGAVVSFD